MTLYFQVVSDRNSSQPYEKYGGWGGINKPSKEQLQTFLRHKQGQFPCLYRKLWYKTLLGTVEIISSQASEHQNSSAILQSPGCSHLHSSCTQKSQPQDYKDKFALFPHSLPETLPTKFKTFLAVGVNYIEIKKETIKQTLF